ncbi:hypothetical protein GGS21DRAFT_499822 [Xylaria nigripes]|nr:hypothetical protein GGS21DRAFT_499822 [Xylaria nigripes]
MRKTLLLCFIHGFKGDDDTFGAKSEFAQHLAAIISTQLPRIDVQAITYPKYETRGDLNECVSRFRDWLTERVIDLEVANGTPSPTVNPSVRTVLVGHSMGGIVAAETVISLMNEDERLPAGPSSVMFPYVQGVLAFDTPFLGIAPGVMAHSAADQYNNAASTLAQLSSLSALWSSTGRKETPPAGSKPKRALTAPATDKTKAEGSSASTGSGWGNLGRIAMLAGAAGAVAAGGAAAYLNREQITTGWSWVTSHLEFVGCLGRAEELKSRVRTMVRLTQELDIGFANLYTRLGKAAATKQVSMVGTVFGNQRTFCVLPSKEAAGVWIEAINDAATDETGAHMSMFESKHNPGYRRLSEDAKDLVVSWSKNEWYETSTHWEHHDEL